MLVGGWVLVLFPGFFQGTTQAVGAGWRSVGLGFAVLVGAPVAMIVGVAHAGGDPGGR